MLNMNVDTRSWNENIGYAGRARRLANKNC